MEHDNTDAEKFYKAKDNLESYLECEQYLLDIRKIERSERLELDRSGTVKERGPLTADKNNPRPENIQLCEQALAAARPWGLEAEVMWSALNAAVEANEHGKTMEEVLEGALGEWDI
jgi:predicted transcriptional regulator